ncbi:protein kinase [Streptosporangium sp. NPDC051023]|uniref:serine/threonine-protein kinase n=1 Tax=Streptosporangium sp. NPDC051023 TaxID=3155410 RepID=UPI00344BC9FF
MAEAGALSVPGYEVSGVLGQGGFGIVYRAKQLAVDREVALKVDNRVLISERDRRRFMREVTSAGALSGHPHVAHVYDAGVLADGRPYMVLELCPGGSLLDRMRSEGPLPPAEVADIGIRIADALAAAHAAGVLHRDIKPANILINRYGNVVLSDFGLATMPSSGGEASVTRESLTPAYAPPEAFDLIEPAAAGDVYSLAATLYALLSGRPPRFPESGVVNIAVIMALHRLPIPEIPGVPSELTTVLRHAMDSDPARRTPSVAALRDALTDLHLDRGARGSRPIPPRPVSLPAPASSPGPAATPQPPFAQGTQGPAPFVSGPRPGSMPFPGGPSPYGMPPAHPAAGKEAMRAHLTSPGLQGLGTTQSPAKDVAPPSGTSNTRVFVAVAVAFAILLLAGVGLMIMENFGQGASLSGQPDTAGVQGAKAGVATVTSGCPAAAVAGAQASCVEKGECWGGLVVIAGDAAARSIPCGEPHAWETFAIATLPNGLTYDTTVVERNPVVKKTCASWVMLASRRGAALKIPPAKWQTTVLPPSKDEFASGARTYRCLGGVLGTDRAGASFRP